MLVKVKGEVLPYAIEHGQIIDGVSFIGQTCDIFSYPRTSVKQEMRLIKESQDNSDEAPNLEDYNTQDF